MFLDYFHVAVLRPIDVRETFRRTNIYESMVINATGLLPGKQAGHQHEMIVDEREGNL